MNRILRILRNTVLWLWALAYAVFAAPVALTWDPNPASDRVAHYELRYGQDLATNFKTVKVADGNEVTLDLPPGVYQFEVLAVSADGLVSLPSNRITHTVLPGAPKTLRVVEIQTSSNLKEWKTVALIPQLPDEAPIEFVRAGIVSITR